MKTATLEIGGILAVLAVAFSMPALAVTGPIYSGDNACPANTVRSQTALHNLTIGAQDADGETVPLDTSKTYLFEAKGQYAYDTRDNKKMADAAYGTSDSWTSVRSDIGIWGVNYKGVASILGSLGQGVGVIEWDNDTLFNPNHEYQFAYKPTNANVQFLISDWFGNWYGNACDNQSCLSDNSGSLTVDVFECVPADVDADGVFDDTDICLGTSPDADGAGMIGGFDDANELFVEWGQNRWLLTADGWRQKFSNKKTTEYREGEQLNYTCGCSASQILEKLNGLGEAMNGHWKFGLSSSVMNEFALDCKDGNIDGVYMIDQLLIDSKIGTPVVSNVPLATGRSYDVIVSGQYDYGPGMADAEYSERFEEDAPDNWVKGEDWFLTKYPTESPFSLDLNIGGNNVDWGIFNSDHEYATSLVGNDAPVQFGIIDNNYGDNGGSLNVKIYTEL